MKIQKLLHLKKSYDKIRIRKIKRDCKKNEGDEFNEIS